MPQRCLDCNNVTLPDDDTGLSASICEHCSSTNLECDHPSGEYVKEKQCFVCSTCGHEYRAGLMQLRKLAENNHSLSQLTKLLT